MALLVFHVLGLHRWNEPAIPPVSMTSLQMQLYADMARLASRFCRRSVVAFGVLVRAALGAARKLEWAVPTAAARCSGEHAIGVAGGQRVRRRVGDR